MEITGATTRVNLPISKLFEIASDCRNFAHYFSDQAKDINATENSCTFTVENIATLTLKIVEKIPYSTIRFEAENDKNIPFFILLNYMEISENETDISVVLHIDLPIFLKPVLQRPLQRFIDTLSEKISNSAEKTEL